MFSTIRSRLIVIGILVAICIWQMIPSKVRVRSVAADGRPIDTLQTVTRPALGLDLQGGMHIALELDQSRTVSSDPARDLELALTVMRKRIDEFGVAEPLVQKVGDERIVVELPGVRDPARAKAVVQRTAALEFRITDETSALDKAIPAMDRMLSRLGVKAGPGQVDAPSAVTELLGGDSASDSTAADTTQLVGGMLGSLIRPSGEVGLQPMPGEYAVPEAAWVRVDSALRIREVAQLLPRGVTWRWNATQLSIGAQPYRLLYVLDNEVMITGEYLEDAQAQLDPVTQGAIYMAIILDDRVQGRPPVIQSQINRNGQITLGGRTIQEAQDLALTLKAGALPVPLKIVEERQVGATLGKDSINAGILASIIGTLFVVVVMIAYYRVAGLLAILALLLYILFSVGGLAAVGATLTLPGLAGLALSIGIAVDANVLIFEGIREQLALGKTVRLAIDEGFKHAMSAIIDSNVTTALTAAFLFQFGTGPVQGFAVTLIIGIAASMVTAIFVTRTFFMIWLERKPAMNTLSI
jgi:preprotein translocase subunit SecD